MRHPGLAVTSRNYNGDTTVIDPLFKRLADHYCEKVLENVVAKNINRCDLTASELGEHIAAYAKLFEQNEGIFPEPATMLEAVASANNNNASRKAVNRYKKMMEEHFLGPNVDTYVAPDVLETLNDDKRVEYLKLFDEMASFGNKTITEESRVAVQSDLNDLCQVYVRLNNERLEAAAS